MRMSHNVWRTLAFSLAAVLAACTYTQKITDGATAYELRRYSEAVPLLKAEYNKAKSRVDQGQLALKLGESYRALHEPADALEWYRLAYDYQAGPEALESYANMLMQTEQYVEALAAYKELGLEIGSRYQYRRQEQAAELARTWDAETQSSYTVSETDFGSAADDYAPKYTPDGQLLITSDRPRSTEATGEDDLYAWTGRDYSDLYVQPLPSGEAEPLSDRVNGEYNEGTGAISPDGNFLVFSRCAPLGFETGYCQLLLSERDGADWAEPQPLPFQLEEFNYVQPAWSADGSMLYFSSDLEGGLGGYDLYVVERKPADDWTEPQPLPRTINTSGNEHFPSVNGDTLLFSSDGLAGVGGLDIYSVYPLGGGTWSTPFNLMPPINGGGDDFGITFAPDRNSADHQYGYLSSSRGDGRDRIFKFEQLPTPEPPVDSTLTRLPEWTLNVYVVETILADPTNPSSQQLGKRSLEGATLKIEPTSRSADLREVEPGVFALPLADSTNYRFLASAPGYLNRDASFSTRRMRRRPGSTDQSFELEIELNKIYAGREIALENIYYDLDESAIRPDAEPTLVKLARDLQLNPDLRIRLGSHTDCRGGDAYNRALAQRRAESAVQFLIEQGIAAERLEAVGFGEDVPLSECSCSRCTEAEHQLNRRTTFAVLETAAGEDTGEPGAVPEDAQGVVPDTGDGRR